ncbi:glycosyltransferase [Gordonia jinghuaiqii]|uniref:Glycosyltransferase n=1 Tax=Gordonia jinghuaiqii TaxID=2758710 RepID=A0A7D7LW26_9ACTN|nr:glycosyltransferase [Gordonia jinghuaiqii]MCR5980386.1 glycosyltransferase [Gordonia jinghuaiqii]QMT01875.1 glycosyltransferase [Gordonia jinghuaiqii]
MRVVHVVTLLSPDGAYGGPTRVALNVAEELIRRGVDVEVAAGTRGFDQPPTSVGAVPLRLFGVVSVLPKVGFAGLASPRQVWWFVRSARRFDVVHVHLARDLVTPIIAAIALILRKPVFVQTHGMIDASDRLLSRPFDLLLIRPILRRARAVFCLTDDEAAEIAVVERDSRVVILANGVPVPPQHLRARPARETRRLKVLFLARLHERKRPMHLVRAALALLETDGDVELALVGPDEGEGEQVVRAIRESDFASRITWEGPIEPSKTLPRMAEADVYVLPSVNEPFGMTVLEAMSIGLPVVVTDSCGLARAVAEGEAGIVVDDSVEALTAAIDRYRCDPALVERHGAHARRLVSESYCMADVGTVLMREYQAPAGRDHGHDDAANANRAVRC